MSELQKYINDLADEAYNAGKFNSFGPGAWLAALEWAENEAATHEEVEVLVYADR
jgi:hypothetical protein